MGTLAPELEELVPPPWRPESATRLGSWSAGLTKPLALEQGEDALESGDKHMLLLSYHLPKHALWACQFLEENAPSPEELNESVSIMTLRLSLGRKNQGHYLNTEPEEMEPVDLPGVTHGYVMGL